MATATRNIVSLPVEMLTQIFESLDSFAAVTNLTCSCKFLANVYTENKGPICLGVLRVDPIVNGEYLSFYRQAAGVFLAEKGVIRKENYNDFFDAGSDGSSEEISDDESDDGKMETPEKRQVLDLDLEGEKDLYTITHSYGLEAVHNIVLKARTVNRTADELFEKLSPGCRCDCLSQIRSDFGNFGKDILRRAFWDLWVYSACGQQLKGVRPRHPTNGLINLDFCHYMKHTWHSIAMSVIPKAYYRFPGKQMCRVEVVRNIMFDLCYNWGGLYERNYCITEESAFDYCLGYDNGYNS